MMIKLYKKNELTFAIVCIAVYVLLTGNLRSLGDDSPFMMLGLMTLAAILFFFVKKNDLLKTYGLDTWPGNAKQMLYFIPLWIVSTGNLWGGIKARYEGMGLCCAIISFALVGFIEEMIFRGFLFRALLKDGNKTKAIIISAVSFGIGHIVNLLIGQGGLDTVVQILFAIAIGFIYTFVYYRCDSLIPVIISHSIIDVFSVFALDNPTAHKIYIAATLFIAITYCFYLSRLKKD